MPRPRKTTDPTTALPRSETPPSGGTTQPSTRLPRSETQALTVHPLTQTAPAKKVEAGRPAKLEMPPLPLMPMTDVEQSLFDYFIAAYKQQYPDMVPTDHLLLHLAGLEYIKYLRVVAEELESHKVISMARQHPGVNMRALLDQLSVTRKARTARGGGAKEEDDDAAALREFFMGGGSTKPKPGQGRGD